MITTHVLDTATGRPARAVPVKLERRDPDDGGWRVIGTGETDADGRLRTLTAAGDVEPGTYRITFDTAAYFAMHAIAGFFPTVEIQFIVRDGGQHHHVPLLLSPFAYSTYRGS
jgi:5-hydroxyisourate hydrolase